MPAMPTWLKRSHTTTKDTGLILRGGGINSRVVVYACQLGPHGRSEAAVVHHYGENNARGLKDACAFKCNGPSRAEAEEQALAWVQGQAMRAEYMAREDLERARAARRAEIEGAFVSATQGVFSSMPGVSAVSLSNAVLNEDTQVVTVDATVTLEAAIDVMTITAEVEEI